MLGAHRDWGSLLREPAALRFFVSKSPFLSFVFHVFRRIETDYWRWPRYVSLLPVTQFINGRTHLTLGLPSTALRVGIGFVVFITRYEGL